MSYLEIRANSTANMSLECRRKVGCPTNIRRQCKFNAGDVLEKISSKDLSIL